MFEIGQQAGRRRAVIGPQAQTTFQADRSRSGGEERKVENRALPCHQHPRREHGQAVIDEMEDFGLFTPVDLLA